MINLFLVVPIISADKLNFGSLHLITQLPDIIEIGAVPVSLSKKGE
jgi:hypothetical protein